MSSEQNENPDEAVTATTKAPTSNTDKHVYINDEIIVLPLDEAPSMGSQSEERAAGDGEDDIDLLDDGSDLTVVAGTRLYSKGIESMKARVERHIKEKEEREKKEAEGLTFEPEIKDKPKHTKDHMDGFVQRVSHWSSQNKRKKEEKAKKHLKELEESETFAPALDKLSAKLVEHKKKTNEYRSPVRGWNDHFSDFMVRKNLDVIQGPGGVDPLYPFKPTINASSRDMPMTARAHERLWDDVSHREAQMNLMRSWDNVRQGYDVKTGQPLFHPVTNSSSNTSMSRTPSRLSDGGGGGAVVDGCETSSSRSQGGPVGDVVAKLLERGREYNALREKRLQEQLKEHSFAPKTNPNSRRIVRKIAQVGPTPSRRRSISSNHNNDEHNSTVRSRSAETRFNVNKFYGRVMNDLEYRETKAAELRQRLHSNDEEECTFRPKISAQSRQLFNRHYYNGGGTNADVTSGLPVYSDAAPSTRTSLLSGRASPNIRKQQQQQQQQQALVGGPNDDGDDYVADGIGIGTEEDFLYIPPTTTTTTTQSQRQVGDDNDALGLGGDGSVAAMEQGDSEKSAFLRSLEAELQSTMENWKS